VAASSSVARPPSALVSRLAGGTLVEVSIYSQAELISVEIYNRDASDLQKLNSEKAKNSLHTVLCIH